MLGDLFTTFGTDSVLDEFRRLANQVDQLYNYPAAPTGIRAVQRGSFPPMNVGATPEHIDVYLFAADLDAKSIDVSIQQNLLSVSGTRKLEVDENVEYYRRERFDGDFRRTIALTDDVDPDRVQAKYRNGVLHITIPRRETAKPRQITVN
jgi:HSP20 family protein